MPQDDEGTGTPKKPDGTRRRITDRPAWSALAAFLTVMAALLALYGRAIPTADALIALLLIAGAALIGGALVGFLFGVPRRRPGDVPAPAPTPPQPDDPGAADRPSPPPPPPVAVSNPYEPNNSLEQVSDWLTKIIVGVGLVELRKLLDLLDRFGDRVQLELGPTAIAASLIAQLSLVALIICGFLCGYLWTRFQYPMIQADSDNNVSRLLRENNESRAQQQKVDFTALVKAIAPGLAGGLVPVEAEALAVDDADTSPEAEVKRKIARFRDWPREWDSDPAGDLFGTQPEELNGRRLSASITLRLDGALTMEAKVERLAGAEPLVGEVLFLLHPTIPDSTRAVMAEHDRATTAFYSEGWFHVAAVMDGGRTVLALDLRNVPGVPAWFRNS